MKCLDMIELYYYVQTVIMQKVLGDKMITNVEIQYFKAITNSSFSLDRFNIFIGANNSGKSSILQAIQFAVGTAQTAQKRFGDLDPNAFEIGRRLSFSENAAAFSYLPIKDLEALMHNRNFTQSLGCIIRFSDGVFETTITCKRGKNRNIATELTFSPLLLQIMDHQPYCVFTPGVSGISISEEFKTKAIVNKSATRGDSNFYLRNILLLLRRQEEKWNSFLEKFHLFFPKYEIDVCFEEEIDETIDAHVTLSNRVKLPIDALGTSALQILQILSYIYFFSPKMLILDEPDTHLHPNNQRKLISVLNDISLDMELQVLLSTHSRHMLDEASSFARILWIRNGQVQPSISDDDNTDFVNILLDLGALDKTDLLSNQYVQWIVCTEDAKAEREEMLSSVLESSGFTLANCLVIPYKGCGQIENVAMLETFIKSFLPTAHILVHRDRDYLDDNEVDALKNKFEGKGGGVKSRC